MSLILVNSPKGGVGSTFIVAQLAIHFAEAGHAVSAIDFTYQDALKLHFGFPSDQMLAPLTHGPGEAMVVQGVEVVSGYEIAGDPAFHEALRLTTPFFVQQDITIVDVSSCDRALFELLLPHAAVHICPLLPRPASFATLPKVKPGTPTVALPTTVFVLNQLDDTRRLSRHTHVFARELFGDNLIGTVRRDEAVNEALAMFQPLSRYAPNSVALLDLRVLAEAVLARLGAAAETPGRVSQ